MTPRTHKLATQADRIEVALFPIPDVVAFPGMTVPLHVFEPRYRQLIHDSMRDQRMVAVSHVLKTIHQPKRTGVLNSNKATYKPHTVFSAGRCRVHGEAAEADQRDLQSAIHRKLIEVVRAGSPDLAEDLQHGDWSTLDPSQYSLQIFRCLRLDPEVMQTILESRSASTRLELIWTVLEQV